MAERTKLFCARSASIIFEVNGSNFLAEVELEGLLAPHSHVKHFLVFMGNGQSILFARPKCLFHNRQFRPWRDFVATEIWLHIRSAHIFSQKHLSPDLVVSSKKIFLFSWTTTSPLASSIITHSSSLASQKDTIKGYLCASAMTNAEPFCTVVSDCWCQRTDSFHRITDQLVVLEYSSRGQSSVLPLGCCVSKGQGSVGKIVTKIIKKTKQIFLTRTSS